TAAPISMTLLRSDVLLGTITELRSWSALTLLVHVSAATMASSTAEQTRVLFSTASSQTPFHRILHLNASSFLEFLDLASLLWLHRHTRPAIRCPLPHTLG
ncbi:hypothetical protein FIBSPDRAFT_874924, partial [Athelia psychrophila]